MPGHQKVVDHSSQGPAAVSSIPLKAARSERGKGERGRKKRENSGGKRKKGEKKEREGGGERRTKREV